RIDLAVDVPVTLGRTGHGADVGLGAHTSISRSALALCRRAGERLAVHSLQSVGRVEVVDTPDHVLATLRRAETHVFAPTLSSSVRIVAGATLAEVRVIEVSVGELANVRAPAAAAAATVAPWSARMLWYPEPQQE